MKVSKYNFFSNSCFSIIEINDVSFLLGCVFSEEDIMNIDSSKVFDHWLFLETIFENPKKIGSEERLFIKILRSVDYIIISNFSELICWPYILKKYSKTNNNGMFINNEIYNNATMGDGIEEFCSNDIKDDNESNTNENENNNKHYDNTNKNNKKNYFKIIKERPIKLITTEVISQLGSFYLNQFYKIFNNHLRVKIGYFALSDDYISCFIDILEKINFNQLYSVSDCCNFIAKSSGYDLGSFNILIKFYDKRIMVLNKSSILKHRYPKSLDINFNDYIDVLIILTNSTNKYSCKNDSINYTIYDKATFEYNKNTSLNSMLNSSYEIYYSTITSIINKINNSTNQDNKRFSDVILIINMLTLLDLIDFIRFKISKQFKILHLNYFTKNLIEYANISHGFISEELHNKIYDFIYPFEFDELMGVQSVGNNINSYQMLGEQLNNTNTNVINSSSNTNKAYSSFYNSYNALSGNKLNQRMILCKGVDEKAQQIMVKQDSPLMFIINSYFYNADQDIKLYIDSIIKKDNVNNAKTIISEYTIKDNHNISNIDVCLFPNINIDPRLTKKELYDNIIVKFESNNNLGNIVDLNCCNADNCFNISNNNSINSKYKYYSVKQNNNNNNKYNEVDIDFEDIIFENSIVNIYNDISNSYDPKSNFNNNNNPSLITSANHSTNNNNNIELNSDAITTGESIIYNQERNQVIFNISSINNKENLDEAKETDKENNLNSLEIKQLETSLESLLFLNRMELVELLSKENAIYIYIKNTETNKKSEIEIHFNNQNNNKIINDLVINTESTNDSKYLNMIVDNIF